MEGYLKYKNEPDNFIYDISYDDLKRLYLQNEYDIQECMKVTQGTYSGESYYKDSITPGNEKIDDETLAFLKEVLYRDTKTSGFIMEYPHGIIIRQAERNHYYRGENQIFEKSIPSLNRKLNLFKSEEKREIYKIIADMRIYEFKNFLLQFRFIEFWQNNWSDVLYEPLAQHYGLETNWLDVTNDFNVALFFATCYYDDNEKNGSH